MITTHGCAFTLKLLSALGEMDETGLDEARRVDIRILCYAVEYELITAVREF